MRNPQKGEYVCTCHAYRYPHRFGGGRCTGVWVVDEAWNKNWGGGDCRHCNLNDEGECQVLSGLEPANECPQWQEFVDYNEIKIYGKKR